MGGFIVSVDCDGRVTLVAELAAAIGWKRKKLAMTAELVLPGLFRVYESDRVAAHVANLLAHSDELEPQLQSQTRAAIEDRYRTLTLYADGRLQLTKEVAAWVGYYPFPLASAHLFAEEFSPGIAVMTSDHRAARLNRLALPLFEQ